MDVRLEHLLRVALLASAIALGACGGPRGDALLERARSAAAAGNHEAAISDAKTYLRDDPNSGAARLLLGTSSLEAGDIEAAVVELRTARRLGVNVDSVLPPLANALLLQGSYEKLLAEVAAEPAVGVPGRVRILTARGDALVQLKRLDAARGTYEQALRLDAKWVPAIVGMATVTAREQGPVAGIAALEGALAVAPDDAQALIELGGLQMETRQFGLARTTFARVQAMEASRTTRRQRLAAIAGLAESQLALGQVDETRVLVEEAARLAPGTMLPLYLQAKVDFLRSDFDAARAALAQVLAAQPDNEAAKLLFGAVNYAQGNLGQADMYLSAVVAADPDNGFARNLLADTRLRQNKPAQALEVVRSAAGRGDPNAAALAARASIDTGDLATGLRYLDQSAETAGRDPRSLLQLAASYIAAGQPDRAMRLLNTAPPGGDANEQRSVLLIVAALRQQDVAQASKLARQHAAARPKDAFAQSLAGVVALRAGDRAQARTYLERSAALEPGEAMAQLNVAKLDMLERSWPAARKRLDAALRLRPDDAAATVALSQVEFAEGRADRGIALLQRAAKANPKAAEPRMMLAQLYLARNQLAAAEPLARQAYDLAPDDPGVMTLLGAVLAASGQRTESVSVMERAASQAEREPRAPVAAAAQFNLAQAYVRSGRPRDALAALSKGLAANPKHLPSLALSAYLLAAAGDVAEARQRIAAIRKIEPQHPAALMLEGDLVLQAGDPAGAAALYEASNRSLPSVPAVSKLYFARRAAGDADASKILQSWLADRPADTAVRMLWAEALQQAGDTAGAQREYETVLRSDAQNVAGLNNLAWLMLERGDVARALELSQRAHRLQPRNASVVDTHGWVLFKSGKVAESIATLREAANLAPATAEIRYHLGAALAASGQGGAARDELRRALAGAGQFPGRDDAEKILRELK